MEAPSRTPCPRTATRRGKPEQVLRGLPAQRNLGSLLCAARKRDGRMGVAILPRVLVPRLLQRLASPLRDEDAARDYVVPSQAEHVGAHRVRGCLGQLH